MTGAQGGAQGSALAGDPPVAGGDPGEGAGGRLEKRKTVEGRVRGFNRMIRTLGFTLSDYWRILSIGTT